ncbi:MAG: hypothetical protein AAFX95_18685 [Cyanobacteria bacterium J06639_16]
MIQTATLQTPWQRGSYFLYDSRAWYYGLLAAASTSNVLYYCTVPLVGIGILAGATLPRRKAVVVLLAMWLVNQLLGFTVRGYPYTVSTFTWGGVMLLGALLTVWLAAMRLPFRQDPIGYSLWLSGCLILGFCLYELVIWLGGFALGGVHGFTLAMLWQIFLGNALWAVLLSGMHGVLAWKQGHSTPSTVHAP